MIRWDDDDGYFVLDQHTELDIYSASSLTQQSAGSRDAPLGYITPILDQPVLAPTSSSCVYSREAANTICIVFSFTRTGIELTIYCTRWEHYWYGLRN
jgi:hypothetical protein